MTTISADPRGNLQTSALKTARNYEKQAIDKLRRMSLAAADLELKSQKKTGQHSLAAANELMYDESALA